MTAWLPVAFLVLAEAALTAGGTDEGTSERLRQRAALIAPILTAENLIARGHSVASVAIDHVERKHGEAPSERDFDLISDAVEIGIVAGYLIALLLAGTEGAR